MEIHKKILLLITIILATIILYRLWLRRIQIKQDPDPEPKPKPKPVKESFANITVNQFINPDSKTSGLNQYCIKASWNTAYTSSNTMDLSMVDNVIRHGCRFLDFEIYSISDKSKDKLNQPEVGYSISADNNMQTDSKNTIPLYDVLHQVIQTNMKMSYRSDPLFIQLRVKSKIPALYQNMVSVLDTIQNKNSNIIFSKDGSRPQGKLSDFKNKIILFADLVNSDPLFTKIIMPETKIDSSTTNYAELKTKTASYFLANTISDFSTPGINSVSNAKTLKLPIRPPVITDMNSDPLTVKFQNCLTCGFDVMQFTQSFPDSSVFNLSNPLKKDIITFIIDYGINILPMRYYIDDNGLADYDEIFGKFGFISISEVLLKYKKKDLGK